MGLEETPGPKVDWMELAGQFDAASPAKLVATWTGGGLCFIYKQTEKVRPAKLEDCTCQGSCDTGVGCTCTQ